MAEEIATAAATAVAAELQAQLEEEEVAAEEAVLEEMQAKQDEERAAAEAVAEAAAEAAAAAETAAAVETGKKQAAAAAEALMQQEEAAAILLSAVAAAQEAAAQEAVAKAQAREAAREQLAAEVAAAEKRIILEAKQAQQSSAAVTLQSQHRGAVARREFIQRQLQQRANAAAHAQRQEGAAQTIQSMKRGRTCRMDLRRKKHSVVVLQATARGHKARVQTRQLRLAAQQDAEEARCDAAARSMQARARGSIARRELAVRLNSSKQIQAAARGRRARGEATLLRRSRSAVSIQRVVRGNHARKDALRRLQNIAALEVRRMEAAEEIQTFWFLSVRRKEASDLLARLQESTGATRVQALARGVAFRAKKRAVTRIQSAARGILVRRSVLRRAAAAIKVQALVRGAVFRMRNRAAVHAQRIVRGHNVRSSMMRRAGSAVKIQAVMRGVTTRTRQRAATKIQALCRGHLARLSLMNFDHLSRKIERMLHEMQVREMYSAEQARLRSAVCIQRYSRGFLVQLRIWIVQEQKRAAATLVQARFRWSKAVTAYQELRTSAVMIQARFRSKLAWEKFGSKVKQMVRETRAATRLQRTARHNACVSRYQQLRCATICTQALRRGHAARQLVLQIRGAIAAGHLQRLSRGIAARGAVELLRKRVAVENEERRQRGACTVQRAVRCYQSRCALDVARRTHAAVLLQTMARMAQSRRRVAIVRRCVRQVSEALTAATQVVQAWYRCVSAVQCYKHLQAGSICVQARYRGNRGRAHAHNRRECVRALQIERVWRGSRGRCVAAKRRCDRQRWACAWQIERVWRGSRGRSIADNRRKQAAATRRTLVLITARVRGMLCRARMVIDRRRLREIAQARVCAMVLIQAQVRGHVSRARVRCLRAASLAKLEFNAAVLIQTRYRTLCAYSRWHELWRCSQAAVVKIQACFRAVHAKRVVSDEKIRIKQLEAASMQFQFRYNGHLDKRTVEHEKRARKSKAEAVIAIQALFRGYHKRLVYRTLRDAHEFKMISLWLALRLQANFQGHIARCMYRRHRDAVILVQSMYRRDFARRFVTSWRIVWTQQRASAMTIQMPVRVYLARQARARRIEKRERELVEEEAAICIASAARAYLSRQHFEEGLLQEEAATCIEACARGFFGRAALERRRHAHRYSTAARLQALVRRSKARQLFSRMMDAHELLLEKEEAAITIQSVVRAVRGKRAFLAAQQNHDDELQQEEAAVCIQAWERKILGQWNYRQLTCVTVLAQSIWRMLPHRREFLRKRSSITCVQNLVRTALAWRHFKLRRRALGNAFIDSDDELTFELEESATCIQMHARGQLARTYIRRKRRSIVVVQSRARGEHARRRVAGERRLVEQMEAVSAQVQFRVSRQEQQQSEEPPAARELVRLLPSRPRTAPRKKSAEKVFTSGTSVWKQAQEDLLLQGAAIAIQAAVRGLLARVWCTVLVQEQQLELLEDAAALAHLEEEQIEECSAAMLLQAVVRMHGARVVRVHRLAGVCAIQGAWRLHRACITRRAYEVAAVRVQACARGWLARARWQKVCASATFDVEDSGDDDASVDLALEEAAICIQTCARGYVATALFRVELHAVLLAAVMLQARWRGLRARAAVVYERQRVEAMEASSCQVQFQARRDYDGERESEEDDSSDDGGDNMFEEEPSITADATSCGKEQLAAVTAIQRIFRGWFDRQMCVMVRLVRRGAATAIQARLRGNQCRRKLAAVAEYAEYTTE